jgi:dethiobiotin synthetase
MTQKAAISKAGRGLFITGTDTGVGKTYVAAMIARQLRAAGHRVGVYKPAASGCRREGGTLISDDATALWEAAGRPRTLEKVCPQRFLAPLSPNVAARAEGREVDEELLYTGVDIWQEMSDIVIVEGIGGLLSPVADDVLVANLAESFGFPLVIVAANRLGAVNQAMMAVHVASTRATELPVAAILLNQPSPDADLSVRANAEQISRYTRAPVIELPWQATKFDPPIDWYALAVIQNRKSKSKMSNSSASAPDTAPCRSTETIRSSSPGRREA